MVATTYKIHTAKEALKEPPPVKWIVDGIIGEESLFLFFGEGGSKKTYSLIDMLVCVSSHQDWIGFPTHSNPTLIIDQESGDLRLWRRLHEMLNGHDIKTEIPLSYICMPCFNLLKQPDTEYLRIAIEKSKARVVLIDALIDMMPGGDDNSSNDTGIVFGNLRKIITALKVSIIVIHHSNRKGSYRGSSNIKGQVDAMIAIESKRGSPNIDFESEKMRDSEDIKFSAVAHFSKDKFYLSASSKNPKFVSTSTEQYIFDSIISPCSLAQLELNAPSNVKPGAIKPALFKLIELKHAKRINPGAQGTIALYGRNGKGSI